MPARIFHPAVKAVLAGGSPPRPARKSPNLFLRSGVVTALSVPIGLEPHQQKLDLKAPRRVELPAPYDAWRPPREAAKCTRDSRSLSPALSSVQRSPSSAPVNRAKP